MAGLTPKQQAFVNEYIVDLNATQAAIRAGYSEQTAKQMGSENLSKPDIQDAISVALMERQARTKVNADYVLKRLVEIDQMDVADILAEDGGLKPISEWPKVWRQYLNGIDLIEQFGGAGDDRALIGYLKKVKWPDKLKNLELLGKHIAVSAFSERVENTHLFSGADGKPVQVTIKTVYVEPNSKEAEA